MRQYMDIKTAAEEFQYSVSMIRKVIGEIQKNHMGPGKRYGQYSFRGNGKTFQIRYAVLNDYMRYRESLNDKVTAKYVPIFDIRAAERELGVIEQEAILIDPESVSEIAQELVRQMSCMTHMMGGILGNQRF